MTNYEKNKELLDMYAVADVPWSVNADGKIFDCYGNSCEDCIFGATICPWERLKWLQEECKEPEVDWSKVEIDTPIYVRDSENEKWKKRYYAGYIGGKVCAFADGKKSEDFFSITHWNYAKLAEQEVEE